jgi:DNA-binding transcriptional MerR regulator
MRETMSETSRGSLPPKLYFRIGEVAGLVGVEPHVLRYWEREFRSIRPAKSSKGQRVYSRRDVENLMRVRELLYGRGFTIAGAKKQLREKGLEPTESAATSAEPSSEAASAWGDAAPTTGVLPQVPPAPSASRMREELETLRTEVEDFLRELSGVS